MSITIRPPEPDDSEILTAIAIHSKRTWGYPEEWIELWADDLTISRDYVEQCPVFAAFADDEIVGWCSLDVVDGMCWLDHLWVLQRFLRQGIGTRLVETALHEAARRGASLVRTVADPNAQGFYEHMGFGKIGEKPSQPAGRVLPVLECIVGE
jgi:GNAT superfamily N-acetyltransferase